MQIKCKEIAVTQASLMQQGDRFYCQFLYLGKVDRDEADAKIRQVDYLLMRLKQGFLQVPPGMGIVTYLEFDGKPPEAVPATRDDMTLGRLRDKHLEVHAGSLEE